MLSDAEFAEADVPLVSSEHRTVHTYLQWRFPQFEAVRGLWKIDVCEIKALTMYSWERYCQMLSKSGNPVNNLQPAIKDPRETKTHEYCWEEDAASKPIKLGIPYYLTSLQSLTILPCVGLALCWKRQAAVLCCLEACIQDKYTSTAMFCCHDMCSYCKFGSNWLRFSLYSLCHCLR